MPTNSTTTIFKKLLKTRQRSVGVSAGAPQLSTLYYLLVLGPTDPESCTFAEGESKRGWNGREADNSIVTEILSKEARLKSWLSHYDR